MYSPLSSQSLINEREKSPKQCDNIKNDTNQHEMGSDNENGIRNFILDIDVDHNAAESTLSDHDVSKQPIMRNLDMHTSTSNAKSSSLNVPSYEQKNMSSVCSSIATSKSPEPCSSDSFQQRRFKASLPPVIGTSNSLSVASDLIQEQHPIFSLHSKDLVIINEPPTKRRKLDHTLVNVTNNNKRYNVIENDDDTNEDINVINDNMSNRQIMQNMLNNESINNNISNQHNNDKNTNVLQSQHLTNDIPSFSKVVQNHMQKLNIAMSDVIKLKKKSEAVIQTANDHINALNKQLDECRRLNEELMGKSM